ncbi:hypothetical protein [Altericroceibacterium xinjiangense]|uniref:hypothetical protein n=1 Tax=Altericroceibacterium xinjiangense TaxID=762261 RepID=UPI000F7F2241|nr:hypothetical protein [Altericroceibacterium xinjiangense]
MARLLSLLIMLALALNGPAVAAAVCHHSSVHAHVLALQSADEQIAAEAIDEENAAATQKSALARAAAMQLAPFLLPEQPIVVTPQGTDTANRHAADPDELTGRAIRPLLEPPVA